MLRVPLDGWIDRISRRMSSGYVTPEVSLERYRKPEIRSDETAIRSDSIRTIRNRWEGGGGKGRGNVGFAISNSCRQQMARWGINIQLNRPMAIAANQWDPAAMDRLPANNCD